MRQNPYNIFISYTENYWKYILPNKHLSCLKKRRRQNESHVHILILGWGPKLSLCSGKGRKTDEDKISCHWTVNQGPNFVSKPKAKEPIRRHQCLPLICKEQRTSVLEMFLIILLMTTEKNCPLLYFISWGLLWMKIFTS